MNSPRKDDHYPPLPPMSVGPAGKCPRCGQGSIFQSFIALKPKCEVCGLDLSFADAADGPAFFVMLIASVPVLGIVLWLILGVGMSYWLTAILTVPLIVIFAILPLRPVKGLLVASQYYHKAEQGRLDND
ncbi:MAG: DUF983 domain-containing protein [Oricola sp.]